MSKNSENQTKKIPDLKKSQSFLESGNLDKSYEELNFFEGLFDKKLGTENRLSTVEEQLKNSEEIIKQLDQKWDEFNRILLSKMPNFWQTLIIIYAPILTIIITVLFIAFKDEIFGSELFIKGF